jgi:hypothetical protein
MLIILIVWRTGGRSQAIVHVIACIVGAGRSIFTPQPVIRIERQV